MLLSICKRWPSDKGNLSSEVRLQPVKLYKAWPIRYVGWLLFSMGRVIIMYVSTNFRDVCVCKL